MTSIPQALAAVLLTFAAFSKGYHLSSCFEHSLVAISFLCGINVSFSMVQTVKAFLSLLFFLVDLAFLKKQGAPLLPKLTYMLGSWRGFWIYLGNLKKWNFTESNSHVMAVEDELFRAELQNGDVGNTAGRLFGLTPKRDNKRSLAQILCFRFYFSCMGFGISHFDEDAILAKQKCMKCHDWAARAIYSLSCHKFLAYSCMTYIRWTSWYVLAFALSIHYTLFICMREMVIIKYPPTDLLLIYNSMLEDIFVIVDCLHMLITGIDIINIYEDLLVDNSAQVKKLFKFKGTQMEVLKCTLLVIIVLVWVNAASSNNMYGKLQFFGFYFYFAVCFVIGMIVHYVVTSSSSTPANISKSGKAKTKARRKPKVSED